MEPVLSYGILVFRFTNPSWNLESALCGAQPTLNGSDRAGALQILMIQRKDSLRFVEFIRGKYTIKDTVYLKQLFSNMTAAERKLVATSNFPDLWCHVWGTTNPRNYRNDFEQSAQKFAQLGESGDLTRLLEETSPLFDTPEWGFPKGRRNLNESDLECAIRECIEETGLRRSQISVFDSVEPLTETFYGDNHVHYCHKYFPALTDSLTMPAFNPLNPHMSREIGAIEWLSIDDALARIRPENVEKKEILLRASALFKSYVPHKNERHFNRSSAAQVCTK
jgi:8-oxo-dGTP pyrophosphatase MutT (NUDIX family)